jgi:hypothetical protein
MQFNTHDGPPSTWDRYGVDGNRDGAKDIYDPEDAIPSAANYLRALLRHADGNLSQAILGYNHSQAYVNDVLARARRYAGQTDDELTAVVSEAGASGCTGGGLDVAVGPANLSRAERLTAPRAFQALPAWAMAGGRGPQLVDVRIYGNVVWILRRYHLRVTVARESGHATHGDGTAVDLIPADGATQAAWDASAGSLARNLGWTPACARSGSRPTCPLVPAIQFIGYDGYPSHGSPRACAGKCPAHIHISWVSGCYGSSSLAPPCSWVSGFPDHRPTPRSPASPNSPERSQPRNTPARPPASAAAPAGDHATERRRALSGAIDQTLQSGRRPRHRAREGPVRSGRDDALAAQPVRRDDLRPPGRAAEAPRGLRRRQRRAGSLLPPPRGA